MRAAEFERLARQASAPAVAERAEQAAAIYRVLEDAGSRAIRGTLTEAAGREFLNRILEISLGEAVDCPTVEGWAEGWLAEKKHSRTEGTFVRYEGILRAFLESLPPSKRSAPITALSIADVRKFRDSFKAGGRTARTVNIAVKVVRSCLAVARRHGYLAHNPADAVEAIAGTAEEREVFTPW